MKLATNPRDRRFGSRIDFPVFLNQYVDDWRFRVLATNLSETGLLLGRVRSARADNRPVFGLEIDLPGAAETIWARGELTRESSDGMVKRAAVRFTGLARAHARLLRDYCIESRRSQLATMLRRIRRTPA